MTTKYISQNYSNGYTLNTKYSALYIERGVTINAGSSIYGLNVPGSATVINTGTIISADIGVRLSAGGSFLNAGYVNGFFGAVELFGAAMSNLGTIKARDGSGVYLRPGSTLINGSASDESALIDGGQGIGIDGATSRATNFGTIYGAVYVNTGALINGSATDSLAMVTSQSGVTVSGAGTVTNFALINGTGAGVADYGVSFSAGGSLTNGSAESHSALVEGYQGVGFNDGTGVVKNFGTINSLGASGRAVAMIDGGEVTNGAFNDAAARISGDYGVFEGGSGAVTNFGTIQATAYGVVVTVSGCVLTNGAATDPSALITGLYAVVSAAAAPTVVNFGSIVSTGPLGAILTDGGVVTNGSAGDTAALVKGSLGVQFRGFGTVSNYATIQGVGGAGVYETGGGTITNGGGFNRGALIEGVIGVQGAGLGTVRNFATIFGSGGGDYGVELKGGGLLVNGSVNNATALIAGYGGAYLAGGTATNFGTIDAEGDAGGAGLSMKDNGSLANGSAGHAGALIEGYFGVVTGANATATVTNFGTIVGQGGAAVTFLSASDVLDVEAGSGFTGLVIGGGGTLDLASGTGKISGFTGAALVVSGSMAASTFQNFGVVEVGAGASFSDASAVTVNTGEIVELAGSLTLGGAKGAITNNGTLETTGSGVLTLAGTVGGKGVATIAGGVLDCETTFNEEVTFTGATGELELAQSQSYAASIAGFSKTGSTSLDLVDIGFVSASEATFSGNTTSGVLTVTDGTHTAKITLTGDYIGSSFIASSDGHGGTIVVDPAKGGAAGPAATGPQQAFVAAMAGMGGAAGGTLQTSQAWTNRETILLSPHAALA